MKVLAGYLASSKPGTLLTDFNGKPLGWRVDTTITNQRTPDGDRVYVLRLVKGNGKTRRVGGGLWLGDAGTLFRGSDLGRAPDPLDRQGWSDLTTELVDEAERWYQTDREDEERNDDGEDDA